MLAKHEAVAARRITAANTGQVRQVMAAETPHGRFTPRQWDVLCLLCEGMPNKLISRNLDISTSTVKIHIAGILRELGVSNRLQAVVAAQRLGLDREWAMDRRKAA